MASFVNLRIRIERCGTINNITALSIFSATSSGILMLFTIPLNAVIIYCILKERKRKYKSLFYKLLLNIAIADLLTGLVVDPFVINALWKEALRKQLISSEVYGTHLSLFFTDAVALMTLTILSIDRIMVLVKPIKHHKGLPSNKGNIFVLILWPVSILLVIPYFKINFIKQLAVFSTVNIIVCVLSLIVTTIIYRRYVTDINQKSKKVKNTKPAKMNPNNSLFAMTQLPSDFKSSKESDENGLWSDQNSKYKQQIQSRQSLKHTEYKIDSLTKKVQNKATKAFIFMLCVFIATYLPTCFTMIYMNVCNDCNCVVIHWMRDISIISILSSSVFRPLNFILTLKHLRSSVHNLFFKKSSGNSLRSNTSGVTGSHQN